MVGAWTTPTSRNSLQMAILGRIIFPAIADIPADITTTALLAVNESVTGQHEHGRDVDWFAFAAEADTNYQFTANQGQKFATLNVLRIFQDDGTELRNSLIAEKTMPTTASTGSTTSPSGQIRQAPTMCR